MSDIPKARKLLREALALMSREHFVKRTARKSVRLTPALAKTIRAYKRKNPKKSNQQIGNRFKVNPGRVTDALAGKK